MQETNSHAANNVHVFHTAEVDKEHYMFCVTFIPFIIVLLKVKLIGTLNTSTGV